MLILLMKLVMMVMILGFTVAAGIIIAWWAAFAVLALYAIAIAVMSDGLPWDFA